MNMKLRMSISACFLMVACPIVLCQADEDPRPRNESSHFDKYGPRAIQFWDCMPANHLIESPKPDKVAYAEGRVYSSSDSQLATSRNSPAQAPAIPPQEISSPEIQAAPFDFGYYYPAGCMEYSDAPQPNYYSCDSGCCECSDTPVVDFYLEHTEGRGIGYHHGYTAFGAFWTPRLSYNSNQLLSDNIRPFIAAEYDVFNNGKSAASVGIGARYISRCLSKVFGVNLYYDYRQACKSFNQVGLGVEMLGLGFDLRANGYIPVGNTHYSHNDRFLSFGEGLCAHRHVINRSYGGIDAELETYLSRWWCGCQDWDFFLAAGGYWYCSKHHEGRHNHINGCRLRTGANYLGILEFELRAYFDNVHNAYVQGLVGFSIPLYRVNDCGCCGTDTNCCCDDLECLAAQRVWRNNIIPEWCTNW